MDTTLNSQKGQAQELLAFSGDLRQKASLAFGALAHAPLVLAHLSQMWGKPHFGYIAVVPIAIGIFAYLRSKEFPFQQTKPAAAGSIVQVIGIATLVIASVLFSPWLGMVAFLINIGGWLLWTQGWANTRRWFAPWLIATLTIGLPFNLDETLILRLKDVSTILASGILDQFGVLHLRSGNVIDVPQKRMFVAEACSGINSFFVTIAFGLCCALWMHRGLIHTLLLVLLSAVVVLFENTMRLVLVVAAAARGQDLLEPTRHDMLGIVLFMCALALVLSTDRLLSVFLPESDKDDRNSRLSHSEGTIPPSRIWHAQWWFPVLLVPCLLVQWMHSPANASPLRSSTQEFLVPELGPDFLPLTLGSLSRIDYRLEERDPSNPFGPNSQVWIYRQGDLQVEVTLDYPYESLHDTCLCYLNTGWKITSEKVVFLDANSNALEETADRRSQQPIGVAHIEQYLTGTALVLFSGIDDTGKIAVRLHSTPVKNIQESLALRFSDQSRLEKHKFFQVQIVARNPQAEQLPSDQRIELIRLYQAIREQIITSVIRSQGASQ